MKRKQSLLMTLALIGVALFAQQIDLSQRPLQQERSRDYDALHYRIHLQLDIAGKRFQGRTTITLRPLRDGFDRCLLDARSFTVTGIWNQWGVPLKFKQTEDSLTVFLHKAYLFEETVSFTVAYAAEDPEGGLRFYTETEDNPMLVASDSWPYGVRHWVPCNDYPNDKATNEVIATVPSDFKVVANGRLESVIEHATDGRSTWHWVQDLPHSTYLFFMSAAPYVVVQDSFGNLPINYWVYPQHAEHARLVFGKTPKMMEFFNRIYGYDYPWDKYDQVVVPFGGGMECTSATAMGHRIMYDKRGEQDFSSVGIVSHELAHQWWGDLITLRTWAHTWMNESFGTYSDYLYYRYEWGDEESAVNLLGKKQSYLREAHTRYIRPIVFHRYRRPQDVFDSHTYPKGACVLHMLRFVLGDDAFFRVLKHFLHTYAFQPVDTHDFSKTVKTVTGQNLDWFFEQWLYQPGHPYFKIDYSWQPEQKLVRLTVEQTQDTSKGIPIYRMPVQIAIMSGEGKSTQKVWIENRKETFEFQVGSRPLLVRFDEGNYLLKEWTFQKSRDELFYQLQNDDVIGRMWAAEELAEFISDSDTMRLLGKTAQSDPFWAVRRSAVQTLGDTLDPQVIPILKKACMDGRSSVRIAALNKLGEFQLAELVSFIQQRFQEDDSYLAQAEALSAMAKCGGPEIVPFLKKAGSLPSPRHVIRRAADRALKTIQNK